MLFAFDFDGVIVDSFDYNMNLMNRVAREFELPELFNRQRVQACDTMTWEFVAEHCGVPIECRMAFKERLFHLLRSEPPEARLFDGMPEVLRAAQGLGHTVVITSNFESLAHEVLGINGIDDTIERIIGAETSTNKTKKLRLAAEAFNVPLSETVKVGDCISDIMHAHDAGARSVAVGWGFHSLEQLITAEPDVVVKTPQELNTLLRNWAG